MNDKSTFVDEVIARWEARQATSDKADVTHAIPTVDVRRLAHALDSGRTYSPPMLLDAAGDEIRQWMHATEQVPQAMPTPGTIVHVCQRAMTALPIMGGKGMLDWTTPALPPVRISIVDGNNPHEVFPLDGEYP